MYSLSYSVYGNPGDFKEGELELRRGNCGDLL
jgi:hypothetical protein